MWQFLLSEVTRPSEFALFGNGSDQMLLPSMIANRLAGSFLEELSAVCDVSLNSFPTTHLWMLIQVAKYGISDEVLFIWNLNSCPDMQNVLTKSCSTKFCLLLSSLRLRPAAPSASPPPKVKIKKRHPIFRFPVLTLWGYHPRDWQKERIVDDLDERSSHGKPWNTYHKLQNVPDLVIYPK